ncbi:MAG: chemotaxis protein CheW [Firmicutes bacterium]|nr:chemotaxis protein CheW [Bacillota bacterium]
MVDGPGRRDAAVEAQEATVLLYMAGGRPFATDIHVVRALARTAEERSVPGMPACFRAVTLVGNKPVGVVGVAAQIGLSPTELGDADEHHYLLAEAGGLTVAFAVQKALRVLQLERGAVSDVPMAAGDRVSRAVAGLLVTEAGLTVLVDPRALLSDDDVQLARDVIQRLQAHGWSAQVG